MAGTVSSCAFVQQKTFEEVNISTIIPSRYAQPFKLAEDVFVLLRLGVGVSMLALSPGGEINMSKAWRNFLSCSYSDMV